MKRYRLIVFIGLLSLLGIRNSLAQNAFFPTKNDFKASVKIDSYTGNYDQGVLVAMEDNIIVIRSFSDDKLYAYKLDSIAKLNLRKGPGFLKIGSPVFLGISTFLLSTDVYALLIGGGIEMLPATAFIPFIAVPTAVLAGTIAFIASTDKSFVVTDKNMDDIRRKLTKYSKQNGLSGLNYQPGKFSFQKEEKKGTAIFKKPLGLNFYFGIRVNDNPSKYIAKSIVENYELTDFKLRHYGILKNYQFGISYSYNSLWEFGFEFFGDPSTEFIGKLAEENEPGGQLSYEFSKNAGGSKMLFLNYSVMGDREQLNGTKTKIGLGLVHASKSYSYRTFPDDFMNVNSNLPFGAFENYAVVKDYGLEIAVYQDVKLKRNSSLSIKGYTQFFPKISFDDYVLTYTTNNHQIVFEEKNTFIPEYGISVSLKFHL